MESENKQPQAPNVSNWTKLKTAYYYCKGLLWETLEPIYIQILVFYIRLFSHKINNHMYKCDIKIIKKSKIDINDLDLTKEEDMLKLMQTLDEELNWTIWVPGMFGFFLYMVGPSFQKLKEVRKKLPRFKNRHYRGNFDKVYLDLIYEKNYISDFDIMEIHIDFAEKMINNQKIIDDHITIEID